MNMKQSCKALICAIEGELDGRHCTEEQAAAILDHALPSLTEALARVEADRDALRFEKADIEGRMAHRVFAAQAQLAEAVGLLHEFAAAQEAKRQGVSNAQRAAGISRLVVAEERVVAFLARHAQAEQQEAQGAQAGDEQVAKAIYDADRSLFMVNCEYADLHPRTKARLMTMARAALATQPAEWADQLYTQGFDAGAAASKRLNAVRGAEHDQ